ncbi:hypothetical protein [Candidatus Odyssella acanthamoebae]|uniref:Uncharacterized protein n=1 Tax=Candidatus Odyssella acanthamoebae TaxID=91604 RepID=A0A077AWX1_9PROT|nr:hypothetical protein [Candidatus Paracaedibacter acanthamoebae]AIK96479.1 hypothetical protein ID47_06570 [Candidatus Paracaedibacter acanthamoebae]
MKIKFISVGLISLGMALGLQAMQNSSTPSEDEMQNFSQLFDAALQHGNADLIIESVQQILQNRSVTDKQYNTLLSYWQRAEVTKNQGILSSEGSDNRVKGDASQPMQSNRSIRQQPLPFDDSMFNEEGRQAMQNNLAIRQQFAPRGVNPHQRGSWSPNTERRNEETMDPALKRILEKRRQVSDSK